MTDAVSSRPATSQPQAPGERIDHTAAGENSKVRSQC